MNSHEIVTALVKAVNLHDTALMEQLIHADFMVEDATGPVKNGREEFLAYWKQEFALFPSYSIELSEIFGDKNVLLATLVSQHAKASSGDATPSHPQKVTWRLEVLDHKISHW
ncbi:MAG: nuclear transport factor 2 family protein, partial [Nitrospirota bacterium]|nr:nuclear transport factor 2 family protein [Nitrospirota bacterium]